MKKTTLRGTRAYAKKAHTVEQQIELLKRRRMLIADESDARHYLSHINYYRLRAYWLPFEVPTEVAGDHAFRQGTSFNDVRNLYMFDRKLRLLVLDAIERFEVSLRAQWAHTLGLHAGSHAHLNPQLFRKEAVYLRMVEDLKEEFEKSEETFAQHYWAAYGTPELPPIWASCELLTFGCLSFCYSGLADSAHRKAIAKPYGVDEHVFSSVVHHLNYIRNVCAHHSRLWNRVAAISMKLPFHPAELAQSLNPDHPKKLYNTLTLLLHLIRIISPDSQWREHVHALVAEYPIAPPVDMGFPADWAKRPLWRTLP